jgi:hypothetical protein
MTGANEIFTVPSNVTDVLVSVSGAQGGNSRYWGGGAGGATVSGHLSVDPAEQLTVLVGQSGTLSGGRTYGGGGASPTYYQASGGGGSFVFDPSGGLLIAAGGGGGGSEFGSGGVGAGAGGTGGGGYTTIDFGGQTGPTGGTPTSGGTHGSVNGTDNGGDGAGPAADGLPGQGGDGAGLSYDAYYNGAGGGGGNYGGGGGSYTESGAGGSGYADPSITNLTSADGVHGGDGVVSFTWALAPATVALSASPQSGNRVGDPITLTANVSGSLGAVTGTVRFDANGNPLDDCLVQPVTDGVATCVTTALVAGANSLQASYSGDTTYAAATSDSASAQVAYPTAVAVTAPETVFGQDVQATATVTSDNGNPDGTVQFAVDGTDVGTPVTVTDGSASSSALTVAAQTALSVGSHDVTATFTSSDLTAYAGSTGLTTQVVDQAATTATVAVQASKVTATVDVVAPGVGSPTGSVTFSVAGDPVGTASVVNGVATLNYSVPTGLTQTVAAVYAGDDSFLGSSDSTSRSDPTITATVTSAKAASAAGWYRTPVTVTFDCTTDGADLTAPCPAPVQIAANGAGQSVTRTIAATDGGVATATVSGINVDRAAPSVAVAGVKDGGAYGGKAPAARCVARDSLSGVAVCTLSKHRSGAVTSYTVSATDKAGNVTTARGSYQVLGIYLVGATYRNGAFVVHTGHRYTIVVTDQAGRPTYYNASIAPHRPAGRGMIFRAAGHHQWTMTVTINHAMRGHHLWNLGVKIGHTMHSVKVQVAS